MASLSTLTAALNLNGAQFMTAINQAVSSVQGLTAAVTAQGPALAKTSSSINQYLTRLERQAELAGKSAEAQLRLQKSFDVQDYGKTASGIIRINDAYDKLIENAQRAEQALGVDAARVVDFGQQLNDMAGAAFRAGLALSSALTAPIVALAKEALRLGSSFEQAEIGFTTMLGSAEEAHGFLAALKDFAAKTPFEFPELLEASKRMQALGFSAQDTIPMLRTVGDAVAGLGGGAPLIQRITLALGQMQAKGKVSAEEMRQLAEAGIPAWKALADSIGKSVPEAMKMAERGVLTAAEGIPAILEGMNKKFAGLMDAQSRTVSGQFSNMKDKITFILADIGKSLIPFAQSIMKVIEPVVGMIGSLAKAFSEASEPVKAFVIGFLAVTAALGPALLAFSGFAAVLAPVATALGTTGILATLSALWPIVLGVAAAIGVLAAAFAVMNIPVVNKALHDLWDTLSAFWNDTLKPVTDYVLAFGAAYVKAAEEIISSGIKNALDEIGGSADKTKEKIEKTGPAVDELSGKLKDLSDEANKPFLKQLLGDMSAWEFISRLAKLALYGVGEYLKGELSNIVEAFTSLVWLGNKAWDALVRGLTYVVKGLILTATPVKELHKQLLKLWDFILQLPGAEGIVNSLGGSFTGLRKTVDGYIKTIDDTVAAQQALWAGTAKVATVFETAKKSVDDAKAALDATVEAEKKGKASAEDVAKAYRTLKDAQANAAAVQKDYGEKIKTTANIVLDLGKALNKAQEDHAKLEASWVKGGKGAATWDEVKAAQETVIKTTNDLGKATKDLDNLYQEANGGVSKYAGGIDGVIARMKANIVDTKVAGDAHKELARSTKLAHEAYEALFVQFENGVGSVEKLSAAWEKWQALQKKLHPEQFQKALDQEAQDQAQSVKEGIELWEKHAKVTIDASHSAVQLASSLGKARDSIKEVTEAVGPMAHAHKQAVDALRVAGERLRKAQEDLANDTGVYEDAVTELDAATRGLTSAYDAVKEAAKAYTDELKRKGLPAEYTDQADAIFNLVKQLGRLGVVQMSTLVGQLKDAEEALAQLNKLEAAGVTKDPGARLALEVDIAAKKLEIRRKSGKELNQAEVDALREAQANLDHFKANYLSSMEEIFKWSGTGASPLSKLETDARHAAEAVAAMEDKLTHNIDVATYDQLQLRKTKLETWITYADAAHIKVSASQRRELEKMKADLEKFGIHYKGVWDRILERVKQVIQQIGQVFARGMSDMIQNMIFGSEFNKQLEEQANGLRGSLADNEKEWHDYVVEVSTALEDITNKHAAELHQQLDDLDTALAEETAAYRQYVTDVTAEIAQIQEAHRNELGQEVADLWNAFHEKQDAFIEYEKEIRAKQAQITEDANRQLERQLTDLRENLRDRQEAFDDFIYDSNKKLSEIGEDLGKDLAEVFTEMQNDLAEIMGEAAKDLEDQQREFSEKKSDMELDYNRDVEDLNEDLRDAQKKGDVKQVAEIKKRLARRVEDHKRAMQRLIDDDARKQAEIKEKEEKAAREVRERAEKQTRELKEAAEKQTAAIKLEIDRRTRDHIQYVEETKRREGEIIEDYERNLGRQIQELEDNLAERSRKMDDYWIELGKDLDAATQKHKTEEEKQTKKLFDELAQRTKDYDAFVLSNGLQREAITLKHKTEAEAETKKVLDEFGLRLAAYEQFNLDVQLKLDDLVRRHRDAIDEIKGLFQKMATAAIDGFLTMAAQSLWDEIGRQIKLHWGSLLGDLMDTLGGWVKDAAKAIGGVFGIGGAATGGKPADAPLPIPGGGDKTDPTKTTPPTVPGGGVSIPSLVSLFTDVFSATLDLFMLKKLVEIAEHTSIITQWFYNFREWLKPAVEGLVVKADAAMQFIPSIAKGVSSTGIVIDITNKIGKTTEAVDAVKRAVDAMAGTVGGLITSEVGRVKEEMTRDGGNLDLMKDSLASHSLFLGDISGFLREMAGPEPLIKMQPMSIQPQPLKMTANMYTRVDIDGREAANAMTRSVQSMGIK